MDKKKLPPRKDNRVIVHFDYDAFYASVFEAEKPELKSLPFAVQQKQIIVTCNYVTRSRGLHKLQLIRDAKSICPEVVIELGEDITRFRDASKDLYGFIRGFSWNNKVERLGFDEVWMDVTDIVEFNQQCLNFNDLQHSFFQTSREDPTVGFEYDASSIAGHTYPDDHARVSPEGQMDDLNVRLRLGSHLALHVRHQLEQQKGYTSTVGIATCKLLSKLAGNLNKPKGQTTIMPPFFSLDSRAGNVTTFLDQHDIGKIPGIGFKLAQKLRDFFLDRPAEFDKGLIYGGTREAVSVADVRKHPDVNPETLEKLLAGPGSPHGIGEKIWHLLNGIDNTEVGMARAVPMQISMEDSYIRLDTMPELTKELSMLARSLLTRMRVDLLGSEDDLGPSETRSQSDHLDTQHAPAARTKWLAHPRTIRLTTRPRQPLQPDGSRVRSFKRISHSGPIPIFVFNLNDSIEVLADRLVKECLITMFRKLHPEKAGWNLSLVNLAVTNMSETAGESKTAKGRDIGNMFRRQEDVLKDFRVTDWDTHLPGNDEQAEPTATTERQQSTEPVHARQPDDEIADQESDDAEWDDVQLQITRPATAWLPPPEITIPGTSPTLDPTALDELPDYTRASYCPNLSQSKLTLNALNRTMISNSDRETSLRVCGSTYTNQNNTVPIERRIATLAVVQTIQRPALGRVMDQNFNNTHQYHGDSQGMIFGDNNFFPYDPAALDHQPSGQTILNDTEDDYLSTFFDNPNMAQQAGQFDTMFGMDDKPLSSSHYAAFGSHAMNSQQSSAPLQPPLHKSHVIAHDSSSKSESRQQPDLNGQMSELDNGLFDAANSLYHLNKSHPPYPQPASDQHISGSWGNLFNPNVTMGYGMQQGGGYPPAPDRASFGQSSFTPQQSSQQQWSADIARATTQQSAQPASETFHGYPLQPPMWRGAQPDPATSSSSSSTLPQALTRRPAPVSFGSDPHFTDHFSGPASKVQQNKDNNLLNVPHADKVRSPVGHPFPTLSGPQPSSAYGGGAQMSHSHQGGASWGSLRTADTAPRHHTESSNGQTRKRRKSQAVPADDQEWTPGNGAGNIKLEESDDDDNSTALGGSRPTNKRRRPTDSNSPLGDEDDDEETAANRKRGSKKRDNLTEEEKRRNHIQSEKKRREIIQQGYSDLNKLVPCLASGKSGLSRSECLQEIASYLEVLINGTNTMMRGIGMTDDDEPLASINRRMQADADAIEK
ncbi:unnamed protein product [Zymoseptoria tritici ST99CH_3D7]|uniref:BHLH domain-containing protein n=1 Tax=Zymoseptoria tritici (strain ST99CH_3D7) TaxID=1276538 RepID=A0A1X7RFK3_ZYMT9|nr:unnamed protein product [Zymoseptoria tritici ST99CH_3D7]